MSIVTISYNQAEFLEQAILSVLNQDYDNVEYIIVDPGSTDGSREIIEKYREKIDKIIYEKDSGPADGLNKGFSAASGDIFGYLNSDDLLSPFFVSTLVHEFEQYPDADVISAHGYKVDENGELLRRVYSNRFYLSAYVSNSSRLLQQSTLFRKEAFRSVGGFNADNKVSWDGELWVDIALAGGRFRRIHKFLSSFRIYPETITGSGSYEQEIQRQHLRIANKTGICPKYGLRRIPIWLINRISDPIATSYRLADLFRASKKQSL